MSHTTAPWRWETGSMERCLILAPDGRCIAWVTSLVGEEHRAEQEANAALMAASPVMLDALRDAHAYLMAKSGLFGELSYMDGMLLRIVDAAIQEATEGGPA